MYQQKNHEPGSRPRTVNAVQVLTDPESIIELLDFLHPAWENIELLDHPPRVEMSSGKRKFVACEGMWIVSPLKGAYFPMRNDQFELVYEPVEVK